MICHVPNTKFYMKTDKKARNISDEIRLVHTKMMQDLALREKKFNFQHTILLLKFGPSNYSAPFTK